MCCCGAKQNTIYGVMYCLTAHQPIKREEHLIELFFVAQTHQKRQLLQSMRSAFVSILWTDIQFLMITVECSAQLAEEWVQIARMK